MSLGTVRGACCGRRDHAHRGGRRPDLAHRDVQPAAVTQSAPDGSFTFPGVSAGGFTIQVTDPATTLAGSVKGSLSLEGETVTVTVQLEPSGTVAGVVRRADGATPVASAAITLTRPGTAFSRLTEAAADGSYAFTHIPVGDLRLDAREPAGIDVAGATGRIGGEGDVVTATLTMVGTGTLTGTLVESNGVDPVAGVTVDRALARRESSHPRHRHRAGWHLPVPPVPGGQLQLVGPGSAGGSGTPPRVPSAATARR